MVDFIPARIVTRVRGEPPGRSAGRIGIGGLLCALLLAALPRPALMAQTRHVAYFPFTRQLAPPLPAAEPFRFVGEIGGGASAVAVVGHVVYLAEGHRLVVVDDSDPTLPRRVAERGPFQDLIRDIAIAGGRAYLATGTAGLQVLDLADPLAPRLAGRWDSPGDARAVVIAGPLALLADGPGGLRVLDVSNPLPREIGHLDTVQDANQLAVQGDLAYVAVADARSRGLVVVDIADPAMPRELGAVPTLAEALAVAVEGQHAYVAEGSAGLEVLDVSNPARPRRLSTFGQRTASAVVIRGGFGYVAGNAVPDRPVPGNDDGLWIANLSDPRAPTVMASFQTHALVSDLALDGDRLHLADRVAGLITFALGEDGSARPIGALDEPGLQAAGVLVSGGYAYSLNRGLRVIDVSDPTDPVELGRMDSFGATHGAVTDHGHLYVPAGEDGVMIVDVSRPTAPRFVRRFQAAGVVMGVALSGRYAYLAEMSDARLSVIDLSLPEAPRPLGSVPLPGDGWAVAVAGERAFVSSLLTRSLFAVDIADPDHPRLLGMLGKMGRVSELTAAGRFVYLHDVDGTLRIVDAADPTRMHEVGVLAIPSHSGHMTVAGSLVFLSHEHEGVRVVDVSNPSAPRLVASLDVRGEARSMTLSGGYAYLAAGTGGLQVFQVGDGLRPPPATAHAWRLE